VSATDRTFQGNNVSIPTVLRSGGLRVVIYPIDHPPAHVRVLGSDWVVVINLIVPAVREVINCSEREARGAVRLIIEP
jgi:hypothetical protein